MPASKAPSQLRCLISVWGVGSSRKQLILQLLLIIKPFLSLLSSVGGFSFLSTHPWAPVSHILKMKAAAACVRATTDCICLDFLPVILSPFKSVVYDPMTYWIGSFCPVEYVQSISFFSLYTADKTSMCSSLEASSWDISFFLSQNC